MIELIFENHHFVAADKPAGWLSVPSRMGPADERAVVGLALEKQLQAQLWPVHRLDQEVTGILLFAKSAAAHRLACGWFENAEVKKVYEAWTEIRGTVPHGPVEWHSKILRGKKRAYESPAGKPSHTIAEALGPVATWPAAPMAWRLSPITGRSHQLRFDLSRHGFPILGDRLYGSTAAFTIQRSAGGSAIALRCVELRFVPRSQKSEADLRQLQLSDPIQTFGLQAFASKHQPSDHSRTVP